MSQAIALFGGAFNPPHRSHRRLAEAALTHLPIAELRLIPCRDHPMKGQDMAPAADRVKMCELAFTDLSGLSISRIELDRDGPSYTVDSLRSVHAEAADRQIFWLLGSDNLHQLHLWHEYREILRLATLAIYPRLGFPIVESALGQTDLSRAERQAAIEQILDLPADDTSATNIRCQVKRGEKPAQIDPAVADYISRHRLYSC